MEKVKAKATDLLNLAVDRKTYAGINKYKNNNAYHSCGYAIKKLIEQYEKMLQENNKKTK